MRTRARSEVEAGAGDEVVCRRERGAQEHEDAKRAHDGARRALGGVAARIACRWWWWEESGRLSVTVKGARSPQGFVHPPSPAYAPVV